MQVLNPALYQVLRARYGRVHVTNPGVRRQEQRLGNRYEAVVRGENYQLCCPLCGDTKFRLSISYMWLTKSLLASRPRTELAHCYNDSCAVWRPAFWEPIAADLDLFSMGLIQAPTNDPLPDLPEPRQQTKIRLPYGFTPLLDLPASHPAFEFLRKQYPGGLTPEYMARHYGIGYTAVGDPLYKLASERVIFPVKLDGELVAWQGRTIVKGAEPRWYLPPGFLKPVYNCDKVPATDTPVIAEGIPAAIACGPKGVALFGKTATHQQLSYIAGRWGSAIIATDPETFVPDNRKNIGGVVFVKKLKEQLDRVLPTPAKMIRWPDSILDLARRHNNGEDINVPDPADVGPKVMHQLIKEAT